MGVDLMAFYKKYEVQMAEHSMLGKTEREKLNQTITEMADNISKSKFQHINYSSNIDRQNIQLVGKET